MDRRQEKHKSHAGTGSKKIWTYWFQNRISYAVLSKITPKITLRRIHCLESVFTMCLLGPIDTTCQYGHYLGSVQRREKCRTAVLSGQLCGTQGGSVEVTAQECRYCWVNSGNSNHIRDVCQRNLQVTRNPPNLYGSYQMIQQTPNRMAQEALADHVVKIERDVACAFRIIQAMKDARVIACD